MVWVIDELVNMSQVIVNGRLLSTPRTKNETKVLSVQLLSTPGGERCG